MIRVRLWCALPAAVFQVEVNSNPVLETRVEDLVRAFDPAVAPTLSRIWFTRCACAARPRLRLDARLILQRRWFSAERTPQGDDDFGTGANLQVRLNARNSGVRVLAFRLKLRAVISVVLVHRS